jgi:hypothetical protein
LGWYSLKLCTFAPRYGFAELDKITVSMTPKLANFETRSLDRIIRNLSWQLPKLHTRVRFLSPARAGKRDLLESNAGIGRTALPDSLPCPLNRPCRGVNGKLLRYRE